MTTGQQRPQPPVALAYLALGVVYGDIGTSPLYAVRETFGPAHGIALTTGNVLGGLSTIFWALMIVVSLKYVTLIMRADNRGEGGVMALLALASASVKERPHWHAPLLLLGVAGTSLFYGDAILTPAISVVSAIEGLRVGTSALDPYVVPISAGVLVALFLIQRRGTARVGALFAPICAIWFAALAAAGCWNVAGNPEVLKALNPLHAVGFVFGHGFASFVVLGAVLLAVTGAEALYADMGHFGKRAIRIAWFGMVAPALVLNYFGQGALLLADPSAISNPFYLSFPAWALYPMVVLATAATVIASQATISGAFSMTQQAIQLGYLPRMRIVHTSARAVGQIYVPVVNWALLLAVLVAVLGFGTSTSLAAAYGVAVMGTMLVTTLLSFFVVRHAWGYPLAICLAATGLFFVVDAAFLSAALLKIADGGWLPIAVGAALFTLMTTWQRGRSILLARLRGSTVPLESFLTTLFREPPARVPGTAVFLTATPDVVPHALLHNLDHNRVLHERVVFLTVQVRDVPWIAFDERLKVEPLEHGCFRVTFQVGFMNRPDVSGALSELGREHGLELELMRTSFFLSRESVVPVAGAESGMALWRERLFAAMARNAASPVAYFNIPANRVVELGTLVEI